MAGALENAIRDTSPGVGGIDLHLDAELADGDVWKYLCARFRIYFDAVRGCKFTNQGSRPTLKGARRS